ncbi:hypothetical protein CPC08DRAFT_727147 [Agrocybe pediades]|nr:hypothetical protein CPC08DRAFT_727147 [Agrocybe pediades]
MNVQRRVSQAPKFSPSGTYVTIYKKDVMPEERVISTLLWRIAGFVVVSGLCHLPERNDSEPTYSEKIGPFSEGVLGPGSSKIDPVKCSKGIDRAATSDLSKDELIVALIARKAKCQQQEYPAAHVRSFPRHWTASVNARSLWFCYQKVQLRSVTNTPRKSPVILQSRVEARNCKSAVAAKQSLFSYGNIFRITKRQMKGRTPPDIDC